VSVILNVSPTAADTAQAVVDQLEEWGEESIRTQVRFVVALAGGSTPRQVYELWAKTSKLDWPQVDLVFGDERCVPPDHKDSNYGMVKQAFMSHLPRPPRIHRMPGEDPDPDHAALQYERTLNKVTEPDEGVDVTLLGIGADGHTASLFPDAPTLDEMDRRCVATIAPDGKTRRLTLTFGEFRRAGRIVFLVTGKEKAKILREVLEGDYNPQRLPAQNLLRDNELETYLFCDEAAAAGLVEEYEE
jgi:6-phosphogluconolactonase